MRLISLLIVTFVSVRDGQAARRGGGVRRRRLESNFFEQSATITQSIEYESAGGDTFFASGTGIKPISKGSKSSKTKSSKSKKAPPVKGAPGPGGPKGVNTKAPGPGRDPKGSKGENSGPSSKGAGGPKGPKSKDMESQEHYENFMTRPLLVAAFSYKTDSRDKPNEDDYNELVEVTKQVFHSLYYYEFQDTDVHYVNIGMDRVRILGTHLVKFELSVLFEPDQNVPSLWEIESIPEEGFKPGNEYHEFYIELLRRSQSSVFRTTTAIQYINSEEELNAAIIEAQRNSASKNLVAIITPTVVVTFLLILVAIYFVYKRHQAKRIAEPLQTESSKPRDERKDRSDDQTQTSHTESPEIYAKAIPTHETTSNSDDEYSEESYYEEETIYDEETIDTAEAGKYFEDVPLADEKYDMKDVIGEIKKSFIARNIAELKPSGSKFSNGSAEAIPHAEAVALSPPTVSIPRGRVQASNSQHSWIPDAIRQISVPDGFRRDKASSDDEKSVLTIDSQSSSTPEFLKKFKQMGLDRKGAPLKSSPHGQERKLLDKRTVPLPMERGAKAVDDDKSVLTIDSQASSTPEFLKKFKQMGLKSYK